MDDFADLRGHAIPLAGAEPDLLEDDLAPLLERLTGARLVGMGEATHGDHESFAFKQRLIQALVRRGQCDVVIFERGVAEMDAYDHYVTGATDVLSMGGELYPWRVEEVRDLFHWLRDWNAAGGSVHVAGMDMQSPAGLPLALRRLDELGITAPAEWRRLAPEAGGKASDAAWLASALAMWQHAERPALDPAYPGQRWPALLAETFRQWLDLRSCYVRPDWSQYERQRDRFMADNALAQLDRFGRGRKAVLWAHNLHVWLELQSPRIGRHLRDRLGAAYRCLCFWFGTGRYNAGSGKINPETKLTEPGFDWTLRPHLAEPMPSGSVEYLLDQAHLDCFAIEPDRVPVLRRDRPFRCGGGAIFEGESQFSCRCIPAEVCDLLVYFREVEPSRLLETTA